MKLRFASGLRPLVVNTYLINMYILHTSSHSARCVFTGAQALTDSTSPASFPHDPIVNINTGSVTHVKDSFLFGRSRLFPANAPEAFFLCSLHAASLFSASPRLAFMSGCSAAAVSMRRRHVSKLSSPPDSSVRETLCKGGRQKEIQTEGWYSKHWIQTETWRLRLNYCFEKRRVTAHLISVPLQLRTVSFRLFWNIMRLNVWSWWRRAFAALLVDVYLLPLRYNTDLN